MAKTVQVKKHFAFVGGLNTEASPLTFPPNTWADGDNVIPDIDGSIRIRKAMDFEQSYSLSSAFSDTDQANGAFVVGEWNTVGGNGNLNFLVEQRNTTVSFYINAGTTISSTRKSFTIDLSTYKVVGNTETAGVAPISVASAYGKLIITSRDTEPLLVAYDPDTDTISVSQISLQFRDFIGSDDGLDIDERPATLSAKHNYNLLNQGWSSTHITTYFTGATKYPSNAQMWTAGKDSTDAFDQALLDKQDFGTTPAPKGRYVLDLFNRDRSTASGVVGITADTESYRPTTCAFFAGRAWYGGMRSSTIGTWIVFSQVAETDANLGKCYQDADPTSEFISDLVATDGGVIPVQDAGTLIKLIPFQNSMLAIFDNGVWQITGTSQAGFSADAYEVNRITTFGCVSSKSVVVTETGVLYWGEDAIYIINQDQLGLLKSTPITSATIQSLYDDIPMTGKLFSSGVYLASERIVYWLYNDNAGQNGITHRFKKNRLLMLDTRLKAFYTHTIESLTSLSPYLVDAFVTKARSTSTISANVVDSTSNQVIDATLNTVVVTLTPDVTAYPIALKFLCIAPQSATTAKTTIAEFNETDTSPICWRDWYYANTAGINFTGYVTPGYDFGENQGGDRSFQTLYVHVFMRRTETGVDASGNALNTSSCSLQGRWDWSDTSSGNRWSTAQEVYRHRRLWLPAALPSATFDDGEPVVVTKNKVRGRGKALQLKFTSSADKDMQILGWAITYIGNANV